MPWNTSDDGMNLDSTRWVNKAEDIIDDEEAIGIS
jgi:hypothetical protein